MTHSITQKRDGFVATVLLDNPDKLNALNLASWEELARVLTALSEEDDVRCVVIQGAGERAFCAGADISELPVKRGDAAGARQYGAATDAAIEAITGCLHPTVAAIRGPCTGGGLEIACACDIRIAGSSARFGVPINRLGHVLGHMEMKLVLAAAGPELLMEILLEARIIDAEEAARRGLVGRVVPDGELEATVAAAAGRIAEGAPLSNRTTKKFLRRLSSPAHLSEAELDEVNTICDSDDYTEGLRAFLAKQKPVFEGK
ncbi:MAG: enoyl-CoA hydratase/isomerase family protein [Rhodospirillales bacterium]|nr:enoyl-CoA hydratase/isomerase family protein [Rhodospirillales bacterium]